MRNKLLTRALPVLISALSFACAEDGQAVTDFASTRAPRTLEDALFYVSADARGGTAMTLDVATDDVKVIKHELPGGSVQTFPRPTTAGREVVVFTSGRAAEKDGEQRAPAEPAHVLVFNRNGQAGCQKLSGRYTTLSLSEDGKFAIAYGSSGNLVLQNAIEVIDFARVTPKCEESNGATVMDLSFDGRAPAGFIFAPSNGFVRRLAIAPLANALQVIDLEHPERGEISITLSEQATLQPTKVVFAKDQFFVQSSGSPKILTFQSIENQPRGQHPFQLAPSILTASGAVNDLATVGEGETLRLLALSSQLEVFDPRVGTTATVQDVSAFSQIHQFSARSPLDMTVAPRAALYAPGRAQIGFVDLGNETAWSTRNVELIELGDPLSQLIPVPGSATLALVTHGSNRISVVDLEQRTVKKLLLDSASATTLLEQTEGGARLWVGGRDGSLGSVDLKSFLAIEVPLTFSYGDSEEQGVKRDEPAINNAQNLLLVPGPGGTPRRRIAVIQRATAGRVTLLDANNPTAESALEVLGFFLAGLFD